MSTMISLNTVMVNRGFLYSAIIQRNLLKTWVQQPVRYLRRRKAGANTQQQTETIDGVDISDKNVKNLLSSDDNFNSATHENVDDIDEFPSDIEKRNNIKRLQQRHAYRPKTDPKDTSILLFPGQGSQFVGMGRKLLNYPNVKQLYEISSEILEYDLLDLCLNGPKEKLDKTEYCQPAVFVTSLAAVEKLRDDLPSAIERCVSTAGFSVGEYAALVFSGMLEFEDALNIVKLRGELMQQASEQVPGGMMSVFCGADAKLGYACKVAAEYCQKRCDIVKPVCRVANYLCPEAKVVAGNMEALDFLRANAKEFGIRRMKMLPVSGAFHTELMMDAQDPLKAALKSISVHNPLISVHNNVTAKRASKKTLVQNLVKQIFKPVKWEQTMHVLYSREQGERFPATYELGPGKQLGTILRQINSKAFQSYRSVEV